MKRIILLLLPFIVFAQVQYSGSVSPTYLMRISDGSEISLPFRLSDLQLNYSYGNFELKTNMALEARWKGSEAELDIREAYLTWYPSFGEVKVGKIIHTWGAADGNNPTDNINPYDFYYMFLAGTDRKIGILSGSVKAYWKNFNLELVYVPQFTPNRLPFGEEDFPIQFPFKPKDYYNTDGSELGGRIQISLPFGDISVCSYLASDRTFSIVGYDHSSSLGFAPVFGYRSTVFAGGDFVTFIRDFTIRSEMAYFRTHNFYTSDISWIMLTMDGDYIQYVFQIEYNGFSNFNLGTQLIGTYIHKTDGETLTMQGIVPLTKDNFTPGMGTPFAMIAEKALIVNGSTNLFDDRVEISAMSLINLEETGYMLGMNVSYSPIENWEVKLGVSKFIGDADDPDNRFTQMEDFSHLSLGLEFNF